MLAAAPHNRFVHGSSEPEPLAASAYAPDDADEEWAIVQRAQVLPEAFAPLYERYVDAVFGYCYRRTSDRDLAADLTHQIFAKVLAALPGFDRRPRGTFRSWLFSIAHNLVIDTWRVRRDSTSLDHPTAAPVIVDGARSPEECALASEQQRALAAAMHRLTDAQRQVVELRLAGLTGPEIAAALGMNLAAVKSTQFRAYARLRTLLEPPVSSSSTEGRVSHA